MDAKLRACLVELVGTYLVVVVGAGTLCATYLTAVGPGSRALAVALAEGLTLAAAVTVCAPLSPACCNPALTLILWVTKRLEGGRALALGASQFAGAFLAGLSVRLLFSDDVLSIAHLGTPRLIALHPDGSDLTFGAIAAGVSVEALGTFLIAVTAYATLLDPRGPKLGGLLVGLAQVAVVLFGFHLTGGSANPARWAGPGLWQLSVATIANPLAEHPVYWLGPVLGALGGCVFYAAVVRPSGKP